MIVTISTTHQPTSDLGYLLHKHPDKFQSFKLSVGKAHVFYPEYTPEKITAALVLDVDPVDLVRGSGDGPSGFSLGQYVNDRPYVASSFMSVAIAKAYSSALNGNCKDQPQLPEVEMDLEVNIAVLPAPLGGELLIRKLFEPLGYELTIKRHIRDEQFQEWGESKYYSVTLKNKLTLKDLLRHLYVLIPVLDNDKHYFVSRNEIDKLLSKGEEWLAAHPEKEQITKRYLQFGSLSRKALELLREDTPEDETEVDEAQQERKASLHQQRLAAVTDKLKESGAKTVLDLGCGEGKLIRLLLKERQFEKITGMDVSYRELVKAKDRLHYDNLAPRQKERIELFQGALTYRDQRLEGYDAAAVVEVIEHLDANRLQAFARVLFGHARARKVVLTTPNREYNVLYEGMSADSMRHADHRFEWTRAEFQEWAHQTAETYNYTVEFFPIGDVDETHGASSQMAVFTYGN